MINAFSIGNSYRVLIHYHERPLSKINSKWGDWDYLDVEAKLVKQEHSVDKVEIIEVIGDTTRLFHLPTHSFYQIAEVIATIKTELPPPIHENEVELY